MINLGLDISTTTVGWALISHNTQDYDTPIGVHLLDCGYIDLRKVNGLISKSTRVHEWLLNRAGLSGLQIDNIIIEDFIKAPTMGRTSVSTTIMLAQFNGMVQLLLHLLWGIAPIRILPNSARKLAWGSSFQGQPDRKLCVINAAIERYPELTTRLERTKNDTWKYWVADVCDAITLAQIDVSKLKVQ